jgi:D-alanine-D-alanine ligase
VIFGGPSPEHDVSVLTGLQAVRCLLEAGYEVHALYWSKAGRWLEVDARLEAADFAHGPPKGASALELVVGPDGGFRSVGRGLRATRHLSTEVVLVCCHGGPGEDGSLQAVLELAGVPYAGPSVSGAALGMDKLAFGALVANAGLPTLPRRLLVEEITNVDISPPYIVKPRFGGSSIGIEVVADVQAAKLVLDSSVHLSRGAVIEPYRPDLFDLQIAVRSWPKLELSAIERPLRREHGTSQSSQILSYGDKYSGGEGMVSAPRELPAKITTDLYQQIRAVALQLATLVGLRGVARLDFLSNGTSLWVNEINSIPGSLAKYLWIDPELSFLEQLKFLLEEGTHVGTERFPSLGADASILHGASSIASKLA